MSDQQSVDVAEFNVPSIGCGGCVQTITEELEGVAGVESIEGDAGEKQIRVEYRASEVDEEGLKEAIERAGHSVA